MKLKNLTKKLTTLAITALMATTLVSTQNVLAASKSTEEGEQSLCTSNQEKQSSQIYKLFIN